MLRHNRAPKPLKPWKGPKPQLPMMVSKEFRVHYLDLQAYLAKVLRMDDYDLLRATGITHGLFPEYLVTGLMPPASNIGQQTDNIRRGRRTRDLGLVLNVLCLDGFIPRGKYVIDTTVVPVPIIVYTSLMNRHLNPNHPECVAFKKKHRSQEFQRRAKILDKLTLEHMASLENGNGES